MTILTDSSAISKPSTTDAPAESWPGWTDNDRWELGPPADDDHRWASREFGTDFDSPEPAEDWSDYGRYLDECAAATAAVDSMARYLIPADVAGLIESTRIGGHSSCVCPEADAILHAGSSPEHCTCEPCVWARTARYA